MRESHGSASARAGPPVNAAVLDRLRDEIGGRALKRVVAAYLGLLDQRLDRVARALDGGDREDAGRAVLDLRVSSEMLGADRLAELAAATARLVAERRDEQCRELIAEARAEARAVATFIRAYRRAMAARGPGAA
jgi:HPt (histidine-containing phosphotransfer) domain-containing protein